MSIASDYAEAAAEHRQKLVKRIGKLENAAERRTNILEGLTDNQGRITDHLLALENALADARRDHALLTRLVKRMGGGLAALLKQYDDGEEWDHERVMEDAKIAWPYTPIGQAEHDAAMHEEEGAPETRESTGVWGYE